MKRCPRCQHDAFIATAHVTQDWLVDEEGEFLQCMNDCVETTHAPDDQDIWACSKCGYSGAGEEFNVK